jgi:hypothetical protein
MSIPAQELELQPESSRESLIPAPIPALIPAEFSLRETPYYAETKAY